MTYLGSGVIIGIGIFCNSIGLEYFSLFFGGVYFIMFFTLTHLAYAPAAAINYSRGIILTDEQYINRSMYHFLNIIIPIGLGSFVQGDWKAGLISLALSSSSLTLFLISDYVDFSYYDYEIVIYSSLTLLLAYIIYSGIAPYIYQPENLD